MSRAEFYRMVSATLRRTLLLPDVDKMTVIRVARELEHTFAERNTKFDAARFRADCGIE